jgi:hypothetical protein
VGEWIGTIGSWDMGLRKVRSTFEKNRQKGDLKVPGRMVLNDRQQSVLRRDRSVC